MTTYELCRHIRRIIVNKAAGVMLYNQSWGAVSCMDEIALAAEKIKKMEDYRDLQLAELTLTEMTELGFGRWSEESTGRLIPGWMFPFLPNEIKTSCMDGSAVLRKSEMDNDTRFGCLAYSVTPSDCQGSTNEVS